MMRPDRFPCMFAGRLGASLLMVVPLLVMACTSRVYAPGAVVPTQQSLPLTATVTLTQVEAYTVRPGAILATDPALAHHVTRVIDSAAPSRTDWEQAILRYLEARKTFTRVTPRPPADVELLMQVNVYVDPSVEDQFREVYIAHVDALVTDPRTHAVHLSFTGDGKTPRHDREQAYQPINQVVQAALNDLFGKMEQDPRMLALGTGLH